MSRFYESRNLKGRKKANGGSVSMIQEDEEFNFNSMTILDFFNKKQRTAQYDHRKGLSREEFVDQYCGLYQEAYFCDLLSLERKRSERSRKPFILLLLELKEFDDGFERNQVAKKISESLYSVIRDTDIQGWYRIRQRSGPYVH